MGTESKVVYSGISKNICGTYLVVAVVVVVVVVVVGVAAVAVALAVVIAGGIVASQQFSIVNSSIDGRGCLP